MLRKAHEFERTGFGRSKRNDGSRSMRLCFVGLNGGLQTVADQGDADDNENNGPEIGEKLDSNQGEIV